MTKDTKKPERSARELSEPSKKISLAEIFDSLAHDKIIKNNGEIIYDIAIIEKLRAAAKSGTDALERGDFEGFNKAVKLGVDILDEI